VAGQFLWFDSDSKKFRWPWLDSDSEGLGLWLDKNDSGTSLVKTKFHHFFPPKEKPLEKPLVLPGWHPFDAQVHKHVKLHHICKNCVVLHHFATLRNNNAVSNHSRVTHCALCILLNNYKILRNSLANYTQYITIIWTKNCRNSPTFFPLNDSLQQWTQC